MKDSAVRRSGFTPRPIQKLATKRKPKSMLNIECNHFLRTSRDDSTHGHPPMTFRMWRECGKHTPPFPERPDEQYNSNVWRNFRKEYGFYVNTDGQEINEMIASMYPLNVPPPSKVGGYTYSKFLTETPLIKEDKLRKLAIDRTHNDILDFKRLRLRSDMRAPPVDEDGHIVPPVSYKKYAPRFMPPPEVSDEPPPPKPGETRVDIFGRQVPKLKEEPFLWKLTYKLNNPEYDRLMEEVDRRKVEPKRHPPAQSRSSSRAAARSKGPPPTSQSGNYDMSGYRRH